MSEYKIITISRQFGSGGHEIGEKLAERLEIPLYDNQLVTMAAEKLGYTEESVGRAIRNRPRSFSVLQRRVPVSSLDAVPTTYYGTNMTVSMSLSAPKRPIGSNESQSAMT